MAGLSGRAGTSSEVDFSLIDERDVTCLETDVIGRSDTQIERKRYGQER